MELTLDELRENAKLMCNFLELSIVDKRAKKNPTYRIPFSNIPYVEYYYSYDYSIEMETEIIATATKFHSDWNWIMEVVNKFKSVWEEEGFESMSRETDKLAQNISIDSRNIENTYRPLLEFIKWYNTL